MHLAALKTISCLVQDNPEGQKCVTEKDLEEHLLRFMATGGRHTEPVLQMWAAFCLRMILVSHDE